MLRLKTGLRVIACIAVSVTFCGCLVNTGPSKPPPVRIGFIAYEPGELYGPELFIKQAAQLAVEKVNESGGLQISGQKTKVVLVTETIKSRPEAAVAAVRRLINQERVVAIVGPHVSRDAIPAGAVAEESKIPMISTGSTNPQTTAGRQFVFVVSFTDDLQGRTMARFARRSLGLSEAARSLISLMNTARGWPVSSEPGLRKRVVR